MASHTAKLKAHPQNPSKTDSVAGMWPSGVELCGYPFMFQKHTFNPLLSTTLMFCVLTGVPPKYSCLRNGLVDQDDTCGIILCHFFLRSMYFVL